MRSDVLSRHMKQHPSALQTTEEICKDIMLEQVDKVVDMQSAPQTKRKFEDFGLTNRFLQGYLVKIDLGAKCKQCNLKPPMLNPLAT